MFKSIKENVSAEITEKKSKFVCHVFYVESVGEAEEILGGIRKVYHDARHNCFAYKIADGDVFKSSDDGEPSGTAGAPMLNILNGKNLFNILVVVTRYFGGILLGTGGLVRAYSQVTELAIDGAELINQDVGLQASFSVDYKDLETIKYQLRKRGIFVSGVDYGEKVRVIIEGIEDDVLRFKDENIDLNVETIGKKIITLA